MGTPRHFASLPPAYDPLYYFQLAIDTGSNAYVNLLGFLEAGAAEFAGQVPLILKLNSHDLLYPGQDSLGTQTASVPNALRLGSVTVGYASYPGAVERRLQSEQLRGLTVRVIHTDEEWMIAKTVCRVLVLSPASEKRDTDCDPPKKRNTFCRRNMSVGNCADRREADFSNML